MIAIRSLTCLLAIACSVAVAEADGLGDTQLAGALTLDQPIHSKVGVRAQVMGFWVPSQEITAAFLYAGPTWTPFSSERLLWSISPRGVVAMNFVRGEDAYGPALVSYLAINKEQFSLLTVVDGYFAGDQRILYGYYAVDARMVPWLNTGLHVEHVDTAATIGPQVGLTKGATLIEAQLYLGGDAPTVRVLLSIRL